MCRAEKWVLETPIREAPEPHLVFFSLTSSFRFLFVSLSFSISASLSVSLMPTLSVTAAFTSRNLKTSTHFSVLPSVLFHGPSYSLPTPLFSLPHCRFFTCLPHILCLTPHPHISLVHPPSHSCKNKQRPGSLGHQQKVWEKGLTPLFFLLEGQYLWD